MLDAASAKDPQEINQLLDGYAEMFEKETWTERRLAYSSHRERLHKNRRRENKVLVPFVRYAMAMLRPRITNGQSAKPEIRPDAMINYQIESSERLRAALGVLTQVQGADAYKEAILREALLSYDWAYSDVDEELDELLGLAMAYGDGFVMMRVEDGVTEPVAFTPERVDVDPAARRPDLSDARFVRIREPITRGEAKQLAEKLGGSKVAKLIDDAQQLDLGMEGEQDEANDDNLAGNDQELTLEYWVVKDLTPADFEDEEEITDPDSLDAALSAGWYLFEEIKDWIVVEGMFGPIKQLATVGWKVRREVEGYKFAGGHRWIVRIDDVVLNPKLEDQQNPIASGNHPIKHLAYDRLPGELWGQSLCDTLGPLEDEMNDMLDEINDICRRLKPILVVMGGTLTPADEEDLGEEGGPLVVYMDVEGDGEQPYQISHVVQQITGMDMPQGFHQNIERLRNLFEMVSGAYDIRNKEVMGDASGVFADKADALGSYRLEANRKAFFRVGAEIGEDIVANKLRYADERMVVTASDGAVQEPVRLNPHDLWRRQEEVRFDYLPAGGEDLPTDPIARSKYVDDQVAPMIGMPEQVTDVLLDIKNPPQKERIKAALRAIRAAQEANPEQPQEENDKLYEETSQSLNKLAETYAETNPNAAVVIAEQQLNLAKTREVDWSAIRQALGIPVQNQPTPEQAGPAAMPSPMQGVMQ